MAMTARDAWIQADANRCKPKTYFIKTYHSFNFVQIKVKINVFSIGHSRAED